MCPCQQLTQDVQMQNCNTAPRRQNDSMQVVVQHQNFNVPTLQHWEAMLRDRSLGGQQALLCRAQDVAATISPKDSMNGFLYLTRHAMRHVREWQCHYSHRIWMVHNTTLSIGAHVCLWALCTTNTSGACKVTFNTSLPNVINEQKQQRKLLT